MSTGTLALSSSSLLALTSSYTSDRTLIHPGFDVRQAKDDPPMCDDDSIRGPEEARARRPWTPADDDDDDDEGAASSPLLLAAALDSDSIRAARTAGSRDFHREETSSGMTIMLSSTAHGMAAIVSLGVVVVCRERASEILLV
jgi:hypothetical protein